MRATLMKNSAAPGVLLVDYLFFFLMVSLVYCSCSKRITAEAIKVDQGLRIKMSGALWEKFRMNFTVFGKV